jgi:signal transduction histidine kinase
LKKSARIVNYLARLVHFADNTTLPQPCGIGVLPPPRRLPPLNPATKRLLGGLIRVLGALLAVGILAFLYVKSESGELRRQTQVGTHLRQLREIDAGWSRDLAAARNDPFAAEAPPRPGGQRLPEVLDALQMETAALRDATLEEGFASLRQSFLEKQGMMERFAQEAERLRTGVHAFLLQLGAVRQAVGEAAAADPRLRLGELDGRLVSLNGEILRWYVQTTPALRDAIRSTAGALQQQADGLPETLRAPVAALATSAGPLLESEAALGRLVQEIDRLPAGPRVVSMTSAYERAFQAMADEKEQYRVYLVFYSAALLVFLGYVLSQLGRSYVKLNQANEALRASNENLEQRVAERTRELSQALKHLKESELLLVQTEKMSSLGQMVAGIAHEINTPLAYVKSSLSTLQERLPAMQGVVQECLRLIQMVERGDASDDALTAQFNRVTTLAGEFHAEEGTAELQTINTDALHGIEQISEIILNLKNFSRLDRSKVSRFDLNEGLESTLVIARNLVKHKTIKRELGQIPLIECSPSQINQVFLNLITNAAQATRDDHSGEIALRSSVTPDGYVRVDVSDNGHGIPDSVLPKIFDPFFTTKDVGKGTGLGLSIAYKIVQQHGGRIEVRSKVGQGTTFSVLLPVKAAQPQALAA